MTLAFLALAYFLQASPTEAPVADAPTATSANAARADTPSGAPLDDFGFVSWCKGALSGHMELYAAVKPELVRLEHGGKETADDAKLDEQQMAAGRDYLALYARAIEAGERAGGGHLHARGEASQAQGYRIWSAARAADDRTRMWSWLMWELPARCEIAAKALTSNSALFGEAFKAGGASPSAGPVADPAADPVGDILNAHP